ncbi:M23 family metallopeptidase [Wukongibacter sp. M2B1]|uniref:M23 family metallopeptidase n=1 Tax=Wukongibacter sp. M2B1 TaxID=3088895 RepID=UPI003D7A52E7
MTSRRQYLMRARLKSLLIRRRKRKRSSELKMVMISLLFIFILIFVVPIVIIMIVDSDVEEKELAKEIYIPYKYLKRAYIKANKENISFSRLLTYSASEAGFVYDGYTNNVLRRAVKSVKKNEEMNEYQKNLNKVYSKVFDDIRVGPIPEKSEIYSWDEKNKKWKKKETRNYSYTSTNDFGDARTYGGDRKHEGNDIITDMGTPIVTMTDGEVTRLGWNEYGGQRVGITSSKGTYFYYAHMDRYADGIIKGKRVKAGDVIGYVGDTGYGPQGTRGKIIPHLHVQIGYKLDDTSKGYTWFNPYDIIKFLDDYRITLIKK